MPRCGVFLLSRAGERVHSIRMNEVHCRRARRGEVSVRNLVLVLVAAGLFAAIPFILKRNSKASIIARSDITLPSDYVCLSCKHKFSMPWQEADRQVKEGKVLSEPGRIRKFTCPQCGKIEAVIYDPSMQVR